MKSKVANPRVVFALLAGVSVSACAHSPLADLHDNTTPEGDAIADLIEQNITLPMAGPQHASVVAPPGNDITILLEQGGLTSSAKGDFLQITDISPPIMGQIELCNTEPTYCAEQSASPMQPIHLDSRLMTILDEVNGYVNSRITPADDMDVYGQLEKWAVFSRFQMESANELFGDCEEYVLTKKRILIEDYGLNPNNMSIVVVNDTAGEGHALLGVHTDRGVLLMDNLTDVLRFPNETPYEFISMQISGVEWGKVQRVAYRPL
jgi:predicted transglutaminase-like cysteine proteinase